MSNKNLEQILKVAIEGERKALTQQEYEMWHGVYLKGQHDHYQRYGRYASVREFKPDLEINLDMEERA